MLLVLVLVLVLLLPLPPLLTGVLRQVERVHGSEVGYLEGFPWGTVQPGAARLYVLATGRCGEQTLPRLKMAQ